MSSEITREQVQAWRDGAEHRVDVLALCDSWLALRTELDEANEVIAAARSRAGALEEKARKWDALTEPARMDEKEFAGDPVIAWRAYHEAMARLARLRELGDAMASDLAAICDPSLTARAWRKERGGA